MQKFECFQGSKFTQGHQQYSHLHFSPLQGLTPFEFRRNLRRQKTRVTGLLFGIICVILCLAALVQYRSVTDTHTHTQTEEDGIQAYHASIALRGKKLGEKACSRILTVKYILGLSRILMFCGASCTASRPCSAFLGGVFYNHTTTAIYDMLLLHRQQSSLFATVVSRYQCRITEISPLYTTPPPPQDYFNIFD